MTVLQIETPVLDVAYEAGGPEGCAPLLLLHGWPDDVRTYDGVIGALHAAGFRTFALWLRGYGGTRFRLAETMRSGQIAAMAQDVLDSADALGLERFVVVGHDWGARRRSLRAAALDRGQRAVLYQRLQARCA